jgi:hypothetical protein
MFRVTTRNPALLQIHAMIIESRDIKIHGMKERDTVDNRTEHLEHGGSTKTLDLADLSLQELCVTLGVCSRACREDDRHNGGSSDRTTESLKM